MKHVLHKITVSILTVMLVITFLHPNQNVHANDDFLGIDANSAILIEASTGKILYQKNIDTILGIASMTKMMTEYLLLEAIHDGRVSWEQEYRVSDYVYRISQNRGLSNVPLVQDGSYNIRELYEAMAIYSANGATIALAETIAGSETNFVKMMNEKARELGIKEVKFVNSTGLNNSDLGGMHPDGTATNDENIMSARALATLAYELYNRFPEILETASIPKKVFRENGQYPIQMDNWNWMLPTLIFEYEGVDGIKTGYTDFAGYCFTGTASRNGIRFITVVMDAKTNGQSSYKARFEETRKMLDYAFSNFEMKEVHPADFIKEDQATLPVTKGKEDQVPIKTTNAIQVVVKRDESNVYQPTYQIDPNVLNKDGKLTAPVEEGQIVGTMNLTYTGAVNYGYISNNDTNLLSTEIITTSSVEKANGFVLFFRGIGAFFSNLWISITSGIKGIF